MPLDKEQRMAVEEAIMDSQIACDKYLESARVTHYKILETKVMYTLGVLEKHKEALQQDYKRDNYKLHMLVPLQTYYMAKGYLDKKEEV